MGVRYLASINNRRFTDAEDRVALYHKKERYSNEFCAARLFVLPGW